MAAMRASPVLPLQWLAIESAIDQERLVGLRLGKL